MNINEKETIPPTYNMIVRIIYVWFDLRRSSTATKPLFTLTSSGTYLFCRINENNTVTKVLFTNKFF